MKFIRTRMTCKEAEKPHLKNVWDSCSTLIGHSTSSTIALSFDALYEDYCAYCKQEEEIAWSGKAAALDLIRLIGVGIVKVVEDDWFPENQPTQAKGDKGNEKDRI
jgi:hypothetical protein